MTENWQRVADDGTRCYMKKLLFAKGGVVGEGGEKGWGGIICIQ